MLDDQTMRLALGGVSIAVLVLFYLGVYRPTRSSFSGWWSVSLLLAGGAIVLLVFNDSPLQAATYPASVALAAAGSTCSWFAMRSLRQPRLPRWLLMVGPAVILVLASMESTDNSAMATSGPVAFYMAAMFIAGAIEVWRAWYDRRAAAELEVTGEALVALLVMALAATVLSGFYVLRVVMFVAVGADSAAYERIAGSGPEDVMLLLSMVAVTFSVSAVGWDQRTRALRRRVLQDDLTGLWGRTAFRTHAQRALSTARSPRDRPLLVVADIDHFKALNDTHGHAAGDAALRAFASVLTAHLRKGESAGRLGGEEFGMVLLDLDDADALARLRAISDDFAARGSTLGFSLPTVSYGLASLRDHDSLTRVFDRADLAMYAAKAGGRDRAVWFTEHLDVRPSALTRQRHSDREGAAESA